MKVLVFGATGLLGTTLCPRLTAANHNVLKFVRDAYNPCNTKDEITRAFTNAVRQAQPDCVINLIAATNVDECEVNMGYAALLNCFIPQTIGELCRNNFGPHAHFIQISSDQVYDGAGPHMESVTRPINAYALTKLVGEYTAFHHDGCVLRTNFFGKSATPNKSSFSDWLISGVRNGNQLNVFDDVYFSPLGIGSLCNAIVRAIEIRLTGLYNLGSVATGISKAAFARQMLRRTGLDDSLLNFVSVDDAKLVAPRPKDMRMNSSAFAKAASFPIPTIEQEIDNEAQNYVRQ